MKNNPKAALRAADLALDLANKADESAWTDIDPEEAGGDPEIWEAHRSAAEAADMARKAASEAMTLAQGEAPATAAARRIALKKLGLTTLETRRSDELDFHEHAVWTIQAALEAAYAAGLADGKTIH